MSRNVEFTGSLRSLLAAARSEQLTFLAAGLAYYAFVSVLPLSVLALVVATAVGGETLATEVVGRFGAVLTPTGQDLLAGALTDASGRGGVTIAGLLLTVWGALKVFRGLDVAFSQLYGTVAAESFLDRMVDAGVALLAVGAGVAAVVVVSAALSLVGAPGLDLFATPALAAALTVTFLPLYVLLPDAPVTVRDALPGAALAGGGWAVLGAAFRVYAAAAGGFALYGVVGGVLLLVTWFYLGGLVVLLGGVVNAVLAERATLGELNRQLQQDSRGVSGQRASMTDDQGGSPATPGGGEGVDAAAIAELREDLEDFEAQVEERTVHREEIERELKRYVRRRARRNHARGWGPYLVLLYGTAMTLGAFYFLDGGWAILAMLVIWLSTLGLYTLMVLVGVTVSAVGLPGRLFDAVSDLRG
ncbi:MAG: YhjD/YihY/BrkB family envelope integrity protein [Haloarculaceae archaeon]